MKLNKKGWGFVEFFAFLLIFIICLLMVAFGLKKFGLLDDEWHFIKDQSNTDTPKVTYSELREDMISATMKYINKYYNNELGEDTLNIRVSQLKKEGLLDTLRDDDGKKCSGYVSVYLNGQDKIQYDAYLKCKKYETTGYEARKDD